MSDIRSWLIRHGLEKHLAVFVDNEIDVDLLPHLTQEDIEALGLPIGARRRLHLALAEPVEGEAPASARPSGPLPTPSGEPERRQLTVMFADLVGSTQLSRALDPEDLREVTRSYQDLAKTAIEGYGGFVARYMGDGVLAYFGYPQAHEGDAERAVRAGLAIADEVHQQGCESSGAGPLSVRIGIATGPVVVGDLIGSGASEESPVVGETPNVASRLQSLATPGAVVIAETTRSLVGESFLYRELGPQNLKGVDAPLQCFEVLGAGASDIRFDTTRAGELSPLVGRDEELEILRRRWRAVCKRDGQVVLLSGEAGIGKSRLVQAAREFAGQELRLQCTLHGANTALHPIVDHLSRALDRSRSEGTAALDELEKLVPAEVESRPRAVSLLASLLSISYEGRYGRLDLDARQQLELTLEALLARMLALGDSEPSLIVFEDVHWIDPTSLELLGRLVEAAAGHALLVILSFRPGFDPPWTGEANVTSMRLSKLRAVDCAALVRAVSDRADLSEEVIEEIAERTDGVPLFLEELTKSVMEEALPDAASVRIPATLHDSLMSRLDRLGDAKLVAQTGAVIGREFDHALLLDAFSGDEAALVSGLEKLLDSGLVFRRGTALRLRYVFKHALVQDAAYENLLKSRRREIHARVVAALKAREGSDREYQPEAVALHYSEADLPRQATEYRLRAGNLALQRSATAEAAVQFELGLAQLAKLEPSRKRDEKELDFLVSLVTSLRTSAGWFTQRAIEVNDRARSLCESLDDAPTLFRVLQQDRVLNWIRGRHSATIAVHRAMKPIAERLENQDLVRLDSTFVAWPMLARGEIVEMQALLNEATLEYSEEVCREYRHQYGIDGRIRLRTIRSYATWYSGAIESAARDSEACLGFTRSLGHPQSLTWALSLGGAQPAAMRRDVATARACADEILSLPHSLRSRTDVGWARIFSGWAIGMSGDLNRGIESMRAGLEALNGHHATVFRTLQLGLLAELYLLADETEASRGVLEEAWSAVAGTGERMWEAELHRLDGELSRLEGGAGAAAAASAFVRALDVARSQQARPLQLRAATSLARLHREQGERSEARELLEPLLNSFTEGMNTPDFLDAETLLRGLD